MPNDQNPSFEKLSDEEVQELLKKSLDRTNRTPGWASAWNSYELGTCKWCGYPIGLFGWCKCRNHYEQRPYQSPYYYTWGQSTTYPFGNAPTTPNPTEEDEEEQERDRASLSCS